MALNDPQAFEDLVRRGPVVDPAARRIRFRKATVYRTESELVRFGNDTVERNSSRPYRGSPSCSISSTRIMYPRKTPARGRC